MGFGGELAQDLPAVVAGTELAVEVGAGDGDSPSRAFTGVDLHPRDQRTLAGALLLSAAICLAAWRCGVGLLAVVRHVVASWLSIPGRPILVLVRVDIRVVTVGRSVEPMLSLPEARRVA